MKIKSILALISTAVIASTSVFAGQSQLQYATTLHPAKEVAATLLHPPTDITIINASSSYIYAIVPGSSVDDYLRPLSNDHIYSYDPNLLYTHLVIQDAYRSTLYDYMVCRLAVITVHGSPSRFVITTDNDLCS